MYPDRSGTKPQLIAIKLVSTVDGLGGTKLFGSGMCGGYRLEVTLKPSPENGNWVMTCTDLVNKTVTEHEFNKMNGKWTCDAFTLNPAKSGIWLNLNADSDESPSILG